MRTRLRWIVPALAALSAAFLPAADADPADDRPTVYAHRGGADIAPENTLGAFRQAHESFGDAGVWLELDAQLAADGVLVVIHDDTLDRTTDCAGPVSGFTSAVLADCDAATAWNEAGGSWGFEPVPTLEQVLVEGRESGWRLLVELKNIPGEANFDPLGAAAAVELLRLVEATGFPEDDVVVQSFFPTSLDQIELRNPKIATAFLTASQLPGAPAGVGFYLSANAVYATARGYEVSAPDHTTPDMNAAVVGTAQALGRQVVTWTVNDPARAAELASMGVDGIITDDPGPVLAAV